MPRSVRNIAITFAMLASLFLAACGASSTTGSTALASDQSIILPNVGVPEIATFDPALPSDLNSAEAIQMAFSGLVSLDPTTLNVVADMATTIPTVANGGITNGGTTYTFHVKPNLEFSNGDPVTAQTFAFSIDRSLDPRLKSNVATVYLGHIKGAMLRYTGKQSTIIGTGPNFGLNVLDPQTLQINLDSPIAFFLETMTYSTSWAVDSSNASFTDATWTNHAVGTGPFMLQTWNHNNNMIFVPNPHWYGAPSKITKITMPFINDVNTAYSEFKAKQVDFDGLGNQLTADQYVDAKTNLSSELNNTPYLAINYVSPNWNIAPFTDKRVRQAFAYATDRNTIANVVEKGSVIASDHIIPQGMPGYFAGLQGLPFNPTMAKQLISAAYPDITKFPPVTMTYPAVGDNTKIAVELQSEYKTYLGVNITLNGESFNKLVNDVYGNNLQFYMLAWIADYPDPQDWTSLQFTKGAPNNTMNFNDPAFDALTNAGDIDQNPTDRLSKYNQAEEIAVDDVGWIPYIQLKNTYVTQPWLHGLTIDGGGLIPDNEWANIYVTTH